MRLKFFSHWRLPLCAAFLCLAYLGAGPWRSHDVQAQTNSQPSSQPTLRIETEMHTAPIDRIGVDAAGRYLVTGSVDKTVRVWELATGRLLRTLRPPIGKGDEGKIHAVAISPDGSLIAAGGVTGFEWDKQYSVYLFDRESGRLARRLGGLPSAVGHLAFSPDGAVIAAALLRGSGVRAFRVIDGTEIGREKFPARRGFLATLLRSRWHRAVARIDSRHSLECQYKRRRQAGHRGARRRHDPLVSDEGRQGTARLLPAQGPEALGVVDSGRFLRLFARR
jgi:WD domain, G-beta repeat